MPENTLVIERWPVGRLLPYAANARTHSETQVAQIAGSIMEFGFNVPCLVDERGVLIAGHGRVLAARHLGLEDVPVIRIAHLTETQVRAFRIADNRIALNAGWDLSTLRLEIGALGEAGLDLGVLGFSFGELGRLLGPRTGLTDPDEIPESPGEPVTRPGDLWLLGDHRLLCGDATVATDVERLLGGDVPHLMVTDPPYGVNYDPTWRNRTGGATTSRTGKVLNDHRADWREAWALFPGDVAYVWHGALHATTVAESLEAAGFNVRSQIIWAKDRLVLGRGDYHWQHEPCWYAVREKSKGRWSGDRKQTTLWSIASRNQDADTIHGTQKPAECMRRPIENNSTPGEIVYDPFAGSGTTIIAAEQTGRRCLAIELSPAYVDVAVMRWQMFTGLKAVHAASGEGFPELDPRDAQ